ncbi:Protein kinase-like domain [Pseudocohnilembus persalinus]|uniref:Protein kinase-like domain n=1 Tax=Pseudocohnilembus persalinus TaxID=266149 RepID=A0A0V0R6S5_PSEPJ|nr:Protein kinase-like domain [Pseudocohnilembus persalinus]|eukprot:KRX10058.1 Protein kinase-like domain [Pseudocohnilembus persalinus]
MDRNKDLTNYTNIYINQTEIGEQFNQPFKKQIENPEKQKIFKEYIQNKQKQEQQGPKKYYTVQEIQEISEEDKMYIILDKDSGQYFDIRYDDDDIKKSIIFDSNVFDQANSEDMWTQFWDRINKMGQNLLDFAELGEEGNLIKLFQTAKKEFLPIDINHKGFDDYTALHYACQEGNPNIVKILIDKKADLDAKTIFQRTPLHLAALRGYNQIIELLIEKGADINCQDKLFSTPLHYCCEFMNLDIIDIFLKYKANVNLKTHQGISVLEIAQKNQKLWAKFQKYGYKQDSQQFNFERKNFVDKMLSNKQVQQQKMIFQQKIKQVTIQEKVSYEDFHFYQVLGKGAFGKVYLVKLKNSSDQKYYAMKMLDKKKIKQHNLTRYAKVEKNVMSIMKHPFIVELNYAFQTPDGLFLVMQFCPGGDLSELLDRKEKLDEDVARIYLAEVILAIEALHRNNIIFRDLKPANILLDEDGHALLADFGLANHRDDKDEFENNLRKSFLGTPAYLAPEMIKKQGHNRMIDWYLVGVLFYEFLTGITPYYANTKEQLFTNIIKGPLKMPGRGISDQAKDLIIKLLNRNPKKRLGYATDGEEIKKHPFFDGLDWDKVYNKQYPVEKPLKKELTKTPQDINPSSRGGRSDLQSMVLQMDEWSFYQPGNSKKK